MLSKLAPTSQSLLPFTFPIFLYDLSQSKSSSVSTIRNVVGGGETLECKMALQDYRGFNSVVSCNSRSHLKLSKTWGDNILKKALDDFSHGVLSHTLSLQCHNINLESSIWKFLYWDFFKKIKSTI